MNETPKKDKVEQALDVLDVEEARSSDIVTTFVEQIGDTDEGF
jgi:hypothetical protein